MKFNFYFSNGMQNIIMISDESDIKMRGIWDREKGKGITKIGNGLQTNYELL